MGNGRLATDKLEAGVFGHVCSEDDISIHVLTGRIGIGEKDMLAESLPDNVHEFGFARGVKFY
jgi:hypothetical protein